MKMPTIAMSVMPPKQDPTMIPVFCGLQPSFRPKRGSFSSSVPNILSVLVSVSVSVLLLELERLFGELVVGDELLDGGHADFHGELLYPTHSRHLIQVKHISI